MAAEAKGIAEGKVRPTLGDLERLIRLEEFLEGGKPASERELQHDAFERKLARMSGEEVRELLREEAMEALRMAEEAERPKADRSGLSVVPDPDPTDYQDS